jgi:hypothetical protein
MTTMATVSNDLHLDNTKISRQLETAKLFVMAVVICSLITIVSVVVLSVSIPNSGSPVTIIVGIMSPVIMTLLASAIHQNAKGVDGRMSQLLRTTTAQAELQTQTDALRSLGFKLQTLEPGSPEYIAMAEQIQTMSLQFAGVERRIVSRPLNPPLPQQSPAATREPGASS